MRRLVRRPSPAMVVAVAGVVVALSGDAVADGVKAITSVVGKDRVTSRSVKDSSLLLRDLKRSERAKLKGRRGPRGPQGVPGTPALRKVVHKHVDLVMPVAPQAPCPGTPAGTCFLPVTQYATATVSCDPGHAAVGGGVTPDNVQMAEVNETHPTPDGTGWKVTVGNEDVTGPHHAVVTAVCTPTGAG